MGFGAAQALSATAAYIGWPARGGFERRGELALRASGARRRAVHRGMNATLTSMLAVGVMCELDYMGADEQQAARELESELLADAAAGVDLRIRLIGAACSSDGAA